MSETMPQVTSYEASDQRLDDFALWAEELAGAHTAPTDEDFRTWETEFTDAADTQARPEASEGTERSLLDKESLELQVLESPDEPQTAWVESTSGTPTEAEYRQQCYWVFGQFGHAMDVLKDTITTDAEAEEWLEMKMTVVAAKSETDPYKLMEIRSTMIPIWNEYIGRMNIDWVKFEKVATK
ncbi:MAG TPA: hypothetical protein VFQ70_00955 [Candidatus Saccharimonadaceae bacterium]|nr:hypothetical protein [Candidatus Saccharimonadaceae bacterium]